LSNDGCRVKIGLFFIAYSRMVDLFQGNPCHMMFVGVELQAVSFITDSEL
jgi:hypothetical protein